MSDKRICPECGGAGGGPETAPYGGWCTVCNGTGEAIKVIELPEVRNRVTADHIDGTPEGYALRILRFYRARCDEAWEVHGLPENERLIYDLMNETQAQRAKELDRAIAILTGGGRSD